LFVGEVIRASLCHINFIHKHVPVALKAVQSACTASTIRPGYKPFGQFITVRPVCKSFGPFINSSAYLNGITSTRLSKAGQLDYKLADRFINQWPDYKPVRFTIGSQHL